MAQLGEKLRYWISEVPLVSVVIGVLAFYGIFKNLFGHYLEGEKGQPESTESHMLQFGDQMADLVSNRLFTWGGVTVIAFILTLILKHYNDKYDEQEAIRRELEEGDEDEANKENESDVKSKKNKKPSSTKNKNKNEKSVQSKQKKTN